MARSRHQRLDALCPPEGHRVRDREHLHERRNAFEQGFLHHHALGVHEAVMRDTLLERAALSSIRGAGLGEEAEDLALVDCVPGAVDARFARQKNARRGRRALT